MKCKYIVLLLLLTTVFTFVGCDKEDYTGASTLVPVSGVTGSLSWDTTPPASMVEEDVVYTFTVTLDKPQVVDVAIDISAVGGTAIEDEDFKIDHSITIPAYYTTASGKFTIFADKHAEETETVSIRIGSERTANATFEPQTVTVELENLVSPDLELSLGWDGTVITSVSGAEAHLCSDVDLDFFLADADGNFVAVAATASCPETLILSGLADGEYTLLADLWANGVHPADTTLVVPFPITLDYCQVGKTAGTLKQQVATFDSDDCDYYTEDPEGLCEPTTRAIGTVTVTNGDYSISL